MMYFTKLHEWVSFFIKKKHIQVASNILYFTLYLLQWKTHIFCYF